jgi:fatty acid desaturase/predicted heme/steroid binding protein
MSTIITLEELRKHRTPADAWMSHKGRVYNVSNWTSHPGGSVIFTHAGDDFTDIFAAFHPPSALKQLDSFYIGDLELKKTEEQKRFETGYRDLRLQLLNLGMFKADKMYYTFKVFSNLGLLVLSVMCVIFSSSLFLHVLGAIILGLFWQQSGWLSHDFLHHQVFKNRLYGDLMGVFLGNVCQGFSVAWWKSKHNTHHAVPNLHESSPLAADGDPDIDTMPILAWSKTMAAHGKDDLKARLLIKWQAYTYFPVLLLARLAWAKQSWDFQFHGGGNSVKNAALDSRTMQYPVLEKIGLVMHYSGMILIMSYMPIFNALTYFFISQTSCGLFLALVFGLGHNGMSVYPAQERPDFWKLQVSTTRNITPNWFVNWFCGGLQYQVDHHLFPMIPRHNLPKVHKLVESFCKEQNVTYHETNMLVGTIEVLNHLNKVSRDFFIEFPGL